MEVRDEQAFQVLFKMAFAFVQSKEFQHKRIAYHTLRRHLVNRPKRDNRRLLAAAFLGPILKQTFIVERVYLALKFADAPKRLLRFFKIIRPRLFVLHRNEKPVMAPAQFVTQCVTISERKIKQAHVSQIGLCKSFAKIGCQLNRQRRNQSVTIRRRSDVALRIDSRSPGMISAPIFAAAKVRRPAPTAIEFISRRLSSSLTCAVKRNFRKSFQPRASASHPTKASTPCMPAARLRMYDMSPRPGALNKESLGQNC